jgi:TolA-binding protein
MSAAVAPPAVESAGLAETIEPPAWQKPSTGAQPMPSTGEEKAGAEQTLTTPVAPSAIADTGVASPADSDQAAAVETPPVTPAHESPQPAARETPSAAQDSSTASGVIESKRPYELLAAAREAYWLHDYDLAEANYRKWMELEPDNPDSYGELGNLFFSQGKWDEAASAYYEAGVRLVKSGNLQQAGELLEVIRGLNGPQSEDLERLIKQANQ